jgi:hypothetical protein
MVRLGRRTSSASRRQPTRRRLVPQAPLALLDAGGRDRVVQPRVLGVDVDQGAHAAVDGVAQRQRTEIADQRHHPLAEGVVVAAPHLGDQRRLVGEVLIERADRHAGALRHPMSRHRRQPVAAQNLSGSSNDDLDRVARPLLSGRSFMGFLPSGRHRQRRA